MCIFPKILHVQLTERTLFRHISLFVHKIISLSICPIRVNWRARPYRLYPWPIRKGSDYLCNTRETQNFTKQSLYYGKLLERANGARVYHRSKLKVVRRPRRSRRARTRRYGKYILYTFSYFAPGNKTVCCQDNFEALLFPLASVIFYF